MKNITMLPLLMILLFPLSCKKEPSEPTAPEINYGLVQSYTQDGSRIVTIEFFLVGPNQRIIESMFNFIEKRALNTNTWYHAVFIDDTRFAYQSKYPIEAMNFDEAQSRHILATYWFNHYNNNKGFTFYDKNMWESPPQEF